MTHHLQDPAEPPNTRVPDLVLLNAKVLTMSLRQPTAEAVAIQGRHIIAVGSRQLVTGLAGHKTRTFDCQGMTLLPGFNDAHCHLLASAAAMQGVDCRPESVSGIQDLQLAVRNRTKEIRAGEWVRGFGYDDLSLNEKRHPTRWDLDQAAPENPVRLEHRSGHATVMNSLALAQAGINRDTPDPVDGVILREDGTGEPTGLLLEMSGFLSERLGILRNEAEQKEGIKRLNHKLLSHGITSVQDAGPQNSPDRWGTFQKLLSSGQLAPRVTMMAGSPFLADFSVQGNTWDSGDQKLRLGHLKIMLTLTTGQLQPDVGTLGSLIKKARNSGFPVAIHAVESEAVAAAAQALAEIPPALLHTGAGRKRPAGEAQDRVNHSEPRDRIEHCSECPPEVLALVQASGAVVATQPVFIYWNGDNYQTRVEPSTLEWLYPVGRLDRSGVSVAFGSDSPVVDPNPWPGIYSAVTGLTQSGQRLATEKSSGPAATQLVSLASALGMYTLGSAAAEGTQGIKGSIEPGKLADLTLVDQDIATMEYSGLPLVRSLLTIIEGRLAWAA